ncbi:hypothetical protein F8388_007768 [Cannabis sativa]|uniref:Uncharacterized protein n=1 Tax=Cannabis sativa TaxID=3483 RepID=A0A7J6FTA8_CANSA|nr:hypothetical protein F8388_007768 [Cannabis sativa]
MVEMNNNNYKYEFIEEMDPYYDGKTFLPSDSDDDSEDEAGWLTVINQLKLTDGFQVDHLPNSKAIWSWLVVESFYKTYDKHTIEAAHAAVTEFNKLKDKQLEIKGDLSSRSDVEEVETLTALYSLVKRNKIVTFSFSHNLYESVTA